MHQEAGLQSVNGGKHLAVVTQSAVCSDPGLQPAEPQLQEDAAGRKHTESVNEHVHPPVPRPRPRPPSPSPPPRAKFTSC